ncbi:unnamed protein product [Schistosoma turkestanicum]|nr:unnamed protein product [Schistosoma turkestanicum]
MNKTQKKQELFVDETIWRKNFHQLQQPTSSNRFPKDLDEFLKSYHIAEFPIVNLNNKILDDKQDCFISPSYLHDLLQSEMDSNKMDDIIQTMEKRLNDRLGKIIDEVNSFQIFSEIDKF